MEKIEKDPAELVHNKLSITEWLLLMMRAGRSVN